jgi:hypothetical protein
VASDLTATAEANGPARRAAAAAAVAADTSGRLADFGALASNSWFGTNVFATKLSSYGRVGEITPSAAKPSDAFRPRREAFEDAWDHGRRLVYGTVNAGGMGAENFGAFCLLVVAPDAGAPLALAVFPDDSAQRYTTSPAAVDVARASSEATAWADRGDLAVVERGAEALSSAEDGWPDLVCRADRYFEAVRAGAFPTSMVTEVRTRAGFKDWLDELDAHRRLLGAVLEPDESNALDAYDVVQGWRRSTGVILATVPD